MKSGFWQIHIQESDRYKNAFTVPFGQYEWNVMSFDLKNAPSKFQNIINNIFNPYSKFDMKFGFWQIQIQESDRYKTTFNVPFGKYEWNVMSFGLKNAPSEFQKIMNDIFNPYSKFIIVYIDDVLIFSQNIDQHFKHIQTFINIIRQNGLAVSKSKINLFQTRI